MGSFLGNPMELNYGFVYVAHPRAVTHISWRKTSKYMPKGSVSNMLVTSCLDNICRIWVETVLPDDGLVNMNQFDPLASQNPKFRTHRHKHRFMQRLKHMKTCFHIRRHAKHHAATGLSGMAAGFGGLGTSNGFGQPPIPTLPSTYSVHDFHSYGYHGTGVTPGLHFHLAASINAETDIPLVPSMQTNDPAAQPNFILHWLNNKEMHFSLQAEGIMQEMTKKLIEKEDLNHLLTGENSNSDHSDEHHGGVAPDEVKRKLNKMNKSLSHDESQQSDEVQPQQQQQHANRSHSIGAGSHGATVPPSHTLSNTTSIQSLMTDGQAGQSGANVNVGTDSLDMKIECLLRDWHHNPDLLFSIHPIDGSFLIWVIEWLDEYHPGAFRQAQVSFSTRIPAAFPLGDAMSMSTTVSLYSSGINYLHFRDMVIKGASKNGAGSTTKDNSTKEHVDGDTGTPLPSVQEEQDADEHADGEDEKPEAKKAENSSPNDSGNINDIGHHSVHDMLMAPPSPTISMVTKHANGTLNLWQLTFADKSKFSQVLSIGHASRASGHRFRVNDITCHPVLPLLLTTSHHNIPELSNKADGANSPPRFTADKLSRGKDVCVPLGFCSELILWRVDAVGPLSQSGGVSELARINSPEISAFSNVAWIPTLLPSTTLGNLSNSPSACFVASDGESLRVYQAVIDARTLLAEISSSERRHRMMTDSMMSLSTESSINEGMHHQSPLHDKIKIVSQQSTARPGCIIQLDAIDDATHDWQNTQFLHVFQEQLITGERTDSELPGIIDNPFQDVTEPVGGLMEKEMDAMVDLQRNAVFEEPFYIVVLERTQKGTTVHMWRIVIASQPIQVDELSSSMMYVPDSNIVQDLEDPDDRTGRKSTAGLGLGDEHLKGPPGGNSEYCPRVNISTTKVCTQELPLPDGVDVVHASPAAGHLSSSSIYPACFAPYIIVTACSDSTVRFWKCKVTKKSGAASKFKYEWREWDMIRKDQESTIELNGQLLNISAAYSGRIACAYKYGKSFTRPTKADPESRYVNLCVAIYECESTGGSEWVLEDTIHLKNIHLPQIAVDKHIDLSYLYDQKSLVKKQRLQQALHPFTHDDLLRSPNRPGVGGSTSSINNGDITPDTLKPQANGLLAVPSFSTLQSLRKSITEHGNTCPLTQKHLVQLDWVSKEDGSHILTVAVGSKIMLFTPVSSDLAQANMKAMKESQTANRPLLRKASSLARPHFNDEIRWMKLRQIELKTADGLPPLPMQISWVRDGIFVAGMDSEMHVYSQWKPREYEQIRLHHLESMDNFNDTRVLRDEDLRSLVNESNQRRLANVSSMPVLSRISTTNLQLFGSTQDKKKKSGIQSPGQNQDMPVAYDYMNDFGLFEASRIACPVLPQYHPKQLMELLNSGKIRWVKAILAHLVRCISGSCAVRGGGNEEESLNRQQVSARLEDLLVTSCPTQLFCLINPKELNKINHKSTPEFVSTFSNPLDTMKSFLLLSAC